MSDWYDPAQVKKGGPMKVEVPKIEQLLERDPYLKMHEREIRRRYEHVVFAFECTLWTTAFCRYGNYEDFVKRICSVEGGLCEFAKAYENMGCHVEKDNTFVCRQWIPGKEGSVHTFLRVSPIIFPPTDFRRAGGLALRRLQQLEQV